MSNTCLQVHIIIPSTVRISNASSKRDYYYCYFLILYHSVLGIYWRLALNRLNILLLFTLYVSMVFFCFSLWEVFFEQNVRSFRLIHNIIIIKPAAQRTNKLSCTFILVACDYTVVVISDLCASSWCRFVLKVLTLQSLRSSRGKRWYTRLKVYNVDLQTI